MLGSVYEVKTDDEDQCDDREDAPGARHAHEAEVMTCTEVLVTG